jgi:hypothetical protein
MINGNPVRPNFKLRVSDACGTVIAQSTIPPQQENNQGLCLPHPFRFGQGFQKFHIGSDRSGRNLRLLFVWATDNESS